MPAAFLTSGLANCLQVNATGVMPVIFASSLLALPAAAARYTGSAFVASAATLLGPSGALYLPVRCPPPPFRRGKRILPAAFLPS